MVISKRQFHEPVVSYKCILTRTSIHVFTSYFVCSFLCLVFHWFPFECLNWPGSFNSSGYNIIEIQPISSSQSGGTSHVVGRYVNADSSRPPVVQRVIPRPQVSHTYRSAVITTAFIHMDAIVTWYTCVVLQVIQVQADQSLPHVIRQVKPSEGGPQVIRQVTTSQHTAQSPTVSTFNPLAASHAYQNACTCIYIIWHCQIPWAAKSLV